jgi:ABC-type multidrug transport system fused ATPase/permease subunit
VIEVLAAIILAATSGQWIARVGPSGAGRSMTISMLLRLDDR